MGSRRHKNILQVWGGGMSITGFIANEDFWSPPYRIDFAKNRKKSESTQNGLKLREIEKKKFAPW